MLIYQYRGKISDEVNFGYFRNLLEKGDMKFTKPSDFNDPFDCCPTHLDELPDNTLPNAAMSQINETMQSASSSVNGVACFTIHPAKMLMWSHYGDQHKGVCVGFDTKLLLDKVPTNDEGNPLYNEITEVKYTKTRPKADDKASLEYKSDEWIKEEEYRIISGMKKGKPSWGPGVWSMPRDSIKEVIIGARVEPNLKKRIINLINSLDYKINIKIVVLHPKKFELLIENIEDQPCIYPSTGMILNPNGQWQKF
jgi:hypothetical protein